MYGSDCFMVVLERWNEKIKGPGKFLTIFMMLTPKAQFC